VGGVVLATPLSVNSVHHVVQSCITHLG